MLGMNAQAWNTPGGIYDRFAGLMGILATAPNERRKIELARQSHADDLARHSAELAQRAAEHQQDYELKKMYYESLMGKPPTGTAAANNLAWRQAVEQNPPPPQTVLNDSEGVPLTGANDRPVLGQAGTPNTIITGDGTVFHTPDDRQSLVDEMKARQMAAFQDATGQRPWTTPTGIANVVARGGNPYASAVAGAQPIAAPVVAAAAPGPYAGAVAPAANYASAYGNTDPDQMNQIEGGSPGAVSPYSGAVAPATAAPVASAPLTKLDQFKQLSGSNPAPEFVPDLLGPDSTKREAVLNSMPAAERKAAALALMQMGYR